MMPRPFTELTKKNAFEWSTSAENAFQLLKQALTTVPVLRLPNFTQPFVVECDVSSEGIGAILLHDDHPLLLILVKDFLFLVVEVYL